MSDENIQRDLGRIEGRQDAFEDRLNSIDQKFLTLEANLNAKLDKLDASMLELSTSLTTLTERASSWKLPAGVIFGAGAVATLFLNWLDNMWPGIAKLFK